MGNNLKKSHTSMFGNDCAVATSSKLLPNMFTMYWYVTRNVVTVDDPTRTRVVDIIEVWSPFHETKYMVEQSVW